MNKNVLYAIIFVLLLALVVVLKVKKGPVETRTIVKTDTLTINVIDTVTEYYPDYKFKRVVDTIFIVKDDTVSASLPVEQKYYEDKEYQAWVSGYMPSLDSIKTFQNTITRTVTNTVTEYVYPKKIEPYLHVGAFVFDNDIAPNIGATVKFKNDITIGGYIGYYDKSPYYGLSIGYKLGH